MHIATIIKKYDIRSVYSNNNNNKKLYLEVLTVHRGIGEIVIVIAN